MHAWNRLVVPVGAAEARPTARAALHEAYVSMADAHVVPAPDAPSTPAPRPLSTLAPFLARLDER